MLIKCYAPSKVIRVAISNDANALKADTQTTELSRFVKIIMHCVRCLLVCCIVVIVFYI